MQELVIIMVVIKIPIQKTTIYHYKHILISIFFTGLAMVLLGLLGGMIGCVIGMMVSILMNDHGLFYLYNGSIFGFIIGMVITFFYILIDIGKLKFEFKSGCKPL